MKFLDAELYSINDIDEVKQYYIKREMFYQLAILVSIVCAFFLGLSIN